MNVLVIYQSKGGHTRTTATNIAKSAEKMGHTVKTKAVIEVQKSDVENADMLFIGTWVQGMILFGVKPANATLWVPALPSLAGKSVGIFCTYAFNPRNSLNMLGKMLEEKGATIIGKKAFHASKLEDGAEDFVKSVLQTGVSA